MAKDEQETAPFVSKLRAEFPRWGVLHDPFGNIWWAVHHQQTLRAGDGIALREQLLAATQPRGV